MRCLARTLAVFIALTTLAGGASAQTERIHEFHSLIQVGVDGTLTVTETVTVTATGAEIKRGIYRDFPTTYRSPDGATYRVGFEIVEVKHDGAPIAYFTENRSNGVRVYMGSKDIFIDPGRYTYSFTYRTDRQIGFFEKHDELYWNVTGNDWTFPIDLARATVELPDGATVSGMMAYTGRAGERGGDYDNVRDADGNAVFTATRPLAVGEGLTIVVSWPKGFVGSSTRRTPERRDTRDANDDRPELGPVLSKIALWGIVAVMLFYIGIWNWVGRDPEPGTIIPLFKPPPKTSPAAARFILRQGFDERVLAAAVVDMAVQGLLTIGQNDDNDFVLKRSADKSLPRGRYGRLMGKLFKSGPDLVIHADNIETLKAAKAALSEMLEREYEGRYFRKNLELFFLGIAVSLVASLLIFTNIDSGNADSAVFIVVCAALFAGYKLGRYSIATWRRVFAGTFGVSAVFRFLGATRTGLYAVGYLILAGVMVASYSGEIFIPDAVAIGVLLVVNLLFYELMKAPTRLGRRLMDDIEGFCMYLRIAEQPWLEAMHPPEKTPELFERYLPYALALGVETEWAKKFSAHLSTAGMEGGWSPGWFHGRIGRSIVGVGELGDALGDGLTGALAYASTPPVRVSGFRGFSGGGGGGGGGGGF